MSTAEARAPIECLDQYDTKDNEIKPLSNQKLTRNSSNVRLTDFLNKTSQKDEPFARTRHEILTLQAVFFTLKHAFSLTKCPIRSGLAKN